MRSLNICLVSREYPPETAWGGIATYTYTLAHGLASAGHNVHVISLSLDREEYIHYDGQVIVHRIRPVRWFLPLTLFGFPTLAGMLNHSIRVTQILHAIHRQEPFDIVEAPGYFAEALIYSLRPRTGLVIRLYTSLKEILAINKERPSADLKLACWLEKEAIHRATRIVANSQFSAKMALAQHGIPYSRISVIPLGIRIPKTLIECDDNQHDTVNRMVLFAGRLSQRKGAETLLEAIPKVLEKVPDALFVIVGKDRPSAPGGRFYRQYFEDYIADERSRHAVSWKGFVEREELERLYRKCAIFVAPSLYETFGLVHLEAMAYGKPVVACRASSTPEVVVDGETGILIAPEDSKQLAEAIIQLLCDSDLRARMSQAAVTRAKQFSLEAMVEKTLEVYRQVMDEFVLGKGSSSG